MSDIDNRTKASWALAWIYVTGIPALEGDKNFIKFATNKPDDIKTVKRHAEAIVSACDSALALIESE